LGLSRPRASAHHAVRFVKTALTGCSWLLLAAPGSSWQLLAAPGTSWLLLAVHSGLSSGEMMGSPAGKEPGRDAPATQMKRSAAVPGREPTCQLLLDGQLTTPGSMVNGCPLLPLFAPAEVAVCVIGCHTSTLFGSIVIVNRKPRQFSWNLRGCHGQTCLPAQSGSHAGTL